MLDRDPDLELLDVAEPVGLGATMEAGLGVVVVWEGAPVSGEA